MKAIVGAADVARFRELIRARTGMAFPDKREPDLQQAIRRATLEAGLPTASSLYELMARSPGVSATFDGLVSALNVSETHFFRDVEQIDELRRSILPDLVARRRRERRLRIWSAGCSTGEEPYTLAILLRQLVPDLSAWDVLILATDINGASLDRARRGIYREWSFRGMPISTLGRHVVRKGDLYEVVPAIRDMVTFARLNLADPVYPSRGTNTDAMDLILCRNVLLYFDRSKGGEVVGRLWSALTDGGRLLVSRVDSTLPALEALGASRPGSGVFTKDRPSDPPDGEPSSGGPAPTPRGPRHLRSLTAPSTHHGDVRERLPHPTPTHSPVPSTDPRAAYRAVLEAWRTDGVFRARDRVERAIADSPLDASLRYLEGLILVEEGDLAGALRAFRRSTYADPAFAPGHLGQGTAFARAGHRDRARVALENAARLVADLDPAGAVVTPDGLTAAEILELVAGERALLDAHADQERVRG